MGIMQGGGRWCCAWVPVVPVSIENHVALVSPTVMFLGLGSNFESASLGSDQLG
ncbi:hypothetical protein [Agromyces sp. NPDC060279]|uniref:hypothetical protein n=1 Tax=Agromyces sp. NPDC060279 TaxID=3347092 RepID=UPI00364B82FA